MAHLFVIIFTILVAILGLHFMFIGIKEKHCHIFYEGFVMLVLGILYIIFFFS